MINGSKSADRMDSLRNIEPLMKLRNAAIENLKMENLPALCSASLLDDRLCRLDETGFIDNLAKIHPVK